MPRGAALEPAQVLHVELLRGARRHRRPGARGRRDRAHRRAREGAVRPPARRGRAHRAWRQHHAGLLAGRRGHGGRARSASGCAPATSAASTTTATSGSPAAASSSSCSTPARRSTRTRSRRSSSCSPSSRTSPSSGARCAARRRPGRSSTRTATKSSERLGGGRHRPSDVRARSSRQRSRRSERDIAPYKRPSDFMLTDIPLPRTVPLRKITRGQIADSYTSSWGAGRRRGRNTCRHRTPRRADDDDGAKQRRAA